MDLALDKANREIILPVIQRSVTGGRNTGRVGVIKNREKHKGSFETIHVLLGPFCYV
jgi:ribosomal protein S4E